jgi:hypothetical protein
MTTSKPHRRQVSRLKRIADETDIQDLLASAIGNLVNHGIDLPCTMTINDGSVHIVVTARRGSKTYNIDTPDEAFLIDCEFRSYRIDPDEEGDGEV